MSEKEAVKAELFNTPSNKESKVSRLEAGRERKGEEVRGRRACYPVGPAGIRSPWPGVWGSSYSQWEAPGE